MLRHTACLHTCAPCLVQVRGGSIENQAVLKRVIAHISVANEVRADCWTYCEGGGGTLDYRVPLLPCVLVYMWAVGCGWLGVGVGWWLCWLGMGVDVWMYGCMGVCVCVYVCMCVCLYVCLRLEYV